MMLRAAPFLLLLAFLPAPLLAEPTEEALGPRILALVHQLGDEDFAVRRAAYDELAAIGEPALPYLRKALDGDDPQVVLFVERLLDEIRHVSETETLRGLRSREGDFTKSEDFARIVAKGRSLLPALFEMLDEEDAHHPSYDYYRMRNVYLVIGELVGPGDLGLLLSRLSHENIQHRLLLRPILQTFDDDLVRGRTLKLLADPEAHPQIRAHLLELCVNTSFTGHDPRFAEITPALLSDEAPVVRATAARYFMMRRDPAALAPILALCRDEFPSVRTAALHALRSYSGPQVIPALSKALLDPDANVRVAAMQSLQSVGAPDLAPRIRPFLKDPDPNVRANAARVLARFGDKSALPALIALLEERDDNFLTRTLSAVVDALGQIADPLALKPLLTLLDDAETYDRIKNYRYCILRAVVKIGGEDVLEQIRPLLMDPDLQNGHIVLDELTRLDTPAVLPILVEALAIGDARLRGSAVRGLVRLGHGAAAPAIAKALGEEDDTWFLTEALRALTVFGHPAAIPHVNRLLLLDASDPNRVSLFFALIRAAIRFNVTEAAPRIAALAEAESRYRSLAVPALGGLGNQAVVETLEKLLVAETNSGIRHRIALALARLGKKGPLREILDSLDPGQDPATLVARAEVLVALARPEEAIPLAEQALVLTPGNGTHLFNVACIFAQAGKIDLAFQTLHSSLQYRTWTKEQLSTDPDLRALWDDPRFAGILEKAR